MKSFVVGSTTRTAKIYIAAHAPIRTYFTVIAVPDGYTTEQFLRKSGWKDIADQAQEGLFILEPGAGGWGSATDESAYVTAAMSFYISNGYFSIFGEHYLVGYGAGAPPLEAWAAANPLKVISQVYVDSKGLPASHFDPVLHQGLRWDDGPRIHDGGVPGRLPAAHLRRDGVADLVHQSGRHDLGQSDLLEGRQRLRRPFAEGQRSWHICAFRRPIRNGG